MSPAGNCPVAVSTAERHSGRRLKRNCARRAIFTSPGDHSFSRFTRMRMHPHAITLRFMSAGPLNRQSRKSATGKSRRRVFFRSIACRKTQHLRPRGACRKRSLISIPFQHGDEKGAFEPSSNLPLSMFTEVGPPLSGKSFRSDR